MRQKMQEKSRQKRVDEISQKIKELLNIIGDGFYLEELLKKLEESSVLVFLDHRYSALEIISEALENLFQPQSDGFQAGIKIEGPFGFIDGIVSGGSFFGKKSRYNILIYAKTKSLE